MEVSNWSKKLVGYFSSICKMSNIERHGTIIAFSMVKKIPKIGLTCETH